MKRKKRKKSHDPEHIEFIGEKYLDEYYIQVFEYDKLKVKELHDFSKINFIEFASPNNVSWLNVNGLHDSVPIKTICAKLGIHKLVLQDILDTTQRTKLQEYENYIQFSVRSILPGTEELDSEQISFVLGNSFLLSFQEKKGDHFEHIRKKIRDSNGVIRERTADYLLFTLLGAILDNYYETVENIEDQTLKISSIDPKTNPHPDTIIQLEKLKQQLHFVKKNMEPFKTSIGAIEKGTSFIEDRHLKYYYELRDHSSRLLDEIYTLTVRLESATNLFFSLQGYKMNQVMKTLTIISTIFIPLTFIVGVYGMNFKYMPELGWHWGYYTIWGIMLSTIILMLIYFWKKRWF
ncbi:MAG: magnesium/cobalt transporter CorA [Bacteroidales bacterium]